LYRFLPGPDRYFSHLPRQEKTNFSQVFAGQVVRIKEMHETSGWSAL